MPRPLPELIGTKAPTSVKVTLAAVRNAASMTLADVLEQDYRVAVTLTGLPDLKEGIRAQVIDKDRNPQWSPASSGRGHRRTSSVHPHHRPRRQGVLMSEFETILTDVADGVATITINRPKALNALNLQVLTDITDAATAYDADDSVKAIVITGSEKAFAAGADIKEMSSLDFSTAYKADWFAGWTRLTDVRKPVITAVGGYALGGGCELAMMGDILIASTKAKFGQPEINLGVLPGMGGSQRLTRAIGKAKAMDMCLTGRMMGAEEAERSGLVARIVEPEALLDTANEIAQTIASKSRIASAMVKEAVNTAFETTLEQGLRYERRLFHSSLATNDQSEGMAAFVEKRDPNFTDS
jgi:enoyl-CoA hydratase